MRKDIRYLKRSDVIPESGTDRLFTQFPRAKICGVGFILLGLVSCGGREDLAPVVELNWRAANSNVSQYVVRRGDTLYAIAFRYDRDYRELAAANHLYSPYSLAIGQVIHLQSSNNHRAASTPPKTRYAQPRPDRPSIFSWKPGTASNRWVWPAHGRVVANFAPEQGKKGLDIAGKKGDKIYAASSGSVAYAGSGLAGYGNLIIIRHDNQYLTAYGNNSRNLVTEGQTIKAGQAIADMGMVDRRFWGVHFEIRQAGKPVNPLNYLR